MNPAGHRLPNKVFMAGAKPQVSRPFLIQPQKPILSNGQVCHPCAAFHVLGGNMAAKIGQTIRR